MIGARHDRLRRRRRRPMSRKPKRQQSRPNCSSAVRCEWPHTPRRGAARSRAESAGRHRLSRALHGAGVHLDLPGHGTAGLRPSRDRLCAGQMAAGVEIAEALSRELSQPWRLPRGLHRRDRQADRRPRSSRNGCASAAIGIRAAAFRSTCSGRPAASPRGSGFRIRASRPIAAAAKGQSLPAATRIFI